MPLDTQMCHISLLYEIDWIFMNSLTNNFVCATKVDKLIACHLMILTQFYILITD